MHRRTVRSVTCTLCGARVVAERTHASTFNTGCTLLLEDIGPALILFLPSNCTHILAGTEINRTRKKKSKKYGTFRKNYCDM